MKDKIEDVCKADVDEDTLLPMSMVLAVDEQVISGAVSEKIRSTIMRRIVEIYKEIQDKGYYAGVATVTACKVIEDMTIAATEAKEEWDDYDSNFNDSGTVH